MEKTRRTAYSTSPSVFLFLIIIPRRFFGERDGDPERLGDLPRLRQTLADRFFYPRRRDGLPDRPLVRAPLVLFSHVEGRVEIGMTGDGSMS